MFASPDRNGFSQNTLPSRTMREAPLISDGRSPIKISGPNEALRSLECVVPIFNETYEVHEFDGLAVHGVPHINDNRLLHHELGRLAPVSGRHNLLLLHTSLGKRYLMEEYGEQIFPPEFADKLSDFQYIGLGHWHNFQQTSVVLRG